MKTSLNFVWYYPRNNDFSECINILDTSVYPQFFDKLNKTGEIDWKYDPENFLKSSMESLEKSSLYNQPERLEQLLTDLYKDSPRIEFLPVRKFFNFHFAFFYF